MIRKNKLDISNFFNPLYWLYSVILFCSCLLFYTLYVSHLAEVKRSLKNEGRHISSTIEEIFDLSSQLIVYLSEQIAASGTDDLNIIAKIIGKDADDSDSLAWLNVGWINANNMFVFDRKTGFLNPPYNLSHRPYVQECVRTPGKFYTSQVVIGASIGIRKIPGGIGITDHAGRYLGILCVGFKLVDLNYKVQQKLSMANFDDANVSYVILDKDFHIVLHSPDNKIDIESSYYKDTLKNISIFTTDEGILPTPVTYKNITYTYYKKVKNFPYYILTGINEKTSFLYFLWKLCPLFAGLITIGSVCAILLYSNRRQLLKHAEMSQKAKSNFLKEIKNSTKDSLNSILVLSEILNKTLKKEIDVGVTPEKQIELLNKIHEDAFNLYTFATNNLNLSQIDVNMIIKECALIQSQVALLRGVKFKTFLYPQLPLLNADGLRFKQIILGLTSLSLEYSPKGSFIKVSTALQKVNKQDFLELIIEDNGFALSQEELRRMQERLAEETSHEDTSFDFMVIEKLVNLHNGTLQVKSQWNQGKKITITFPYETSFQAEKKRHQTEEITPFYNIVKLQNRKKLH